MGVESGGDKQHLRLEMLDHRLNDLVGDMRKSLVTRISRERQVDDAAFCVKGIPNMACAGIDARLMRGEISGTLIIQKGSLGPVAVMCIVIHNHYTFKPLFECIKGCHCHVVKQTESHGPIWLSMMSRLSSS